MSCMPALPILLTKTQSLSLILQHELIECLGKVGSGAEQAPGCAAANAALIDGVRLHMTEGRGAARENITLMELIGQGSVSTGWMGHVPPAFAPVTLALLPLCSTGRCTGGSGGGWSWR